MRLLDHVHAKKHLKILSRLIAALLVSLCFSIMASEATLPETEMEALRAIAKTLGKTDWDFSLIPCDAQRGGWQFLEGNKKRAVTCNCTLSECHVISICLKSQNLSGALPKNLDGLPFLAELDLTRNYLSGSIPPEWGSTNLVNISLNANRLTGLIPKELGMIVTLANLTLEYNQFSGPLPHELGKLSRLERFCISSNYFNGTLPSSLGSLTNLKDFRIPDNQFQGKIPNFIQNWRNLERLDLKASGLEGPIPSSIGLLKNMKHLQISDLNGPESPFPPLDTMTNLKILILRSCNIVGELPYEIGKIPVKKTLDLSFNRLTGKIPQSYNELKDVDNVQVQFHIWPICFN